jgi:acetyl-CoA carboxylase carboxyltransferase component
MSATEPTSDAPAASEIQPASSLLRPLVEDLEARRARIALGGGQEKIDRQHEKGALTARERIALLIDEGTFVEMGIHATPHSSQRAMDGVDAPADGVITGYGKVDGRLTAVCAYDFTVMAGSMGMTGEFKVTRLRELALTKRIPFVWLLDSAGARVQEAAGAMFAGSGHLFREEVIMSGVIPQVAALLGPCAAGTAYIPGLADFVPMVKGRGSMALAGPHLVRAAVGEEVTQEELGGSRVHCRKSGVGDMEVADDAECIEQIKKYLSYMPQNCEQAPPMRVGGPGSDPIDRREDSLLDVLPPSNRTPYDMYEVIRAIVDDREYLDIKGQWAKTIITCFARFGGRPAGIVANQPRQLGGILDNDSADKAARFVNLCDAFAIPLVFVQDVPGFMVGTKVEAEGIIRHGAKMLHAVAAATVPKITVITRKAYGAGYYVMNGRAYEPDLIVAWPSAEISVMGAEGVVEIAFRKQVEEAEDPEAKRAELIAGFKQTFDVYIAAGNDLIDDVIDPRETRETVCRALEMSAGKKVERPWKRHGVVPV